MEAEKQDRFMKELISRETKEAITELRETEEQASLKFELPVDFMVGPG